MSGRFDENEWENVLEALEAEAQADSENERGWYRGRAPFVPRAAPPRRARRRARWRPGRPAFPALRFPGPRPPRPRLPTLPLPWPMPQPMQPPMQPAVQPDMGGGGPGPACTCPQPAAATDTPAEPEPAAEPASAAGTDSGDAGATAAPAADAAPQSGGNDGGSSSSSNSATAAAKELEMELEARPGPLQTQVAWRRVAIPRLSLADIPAAPGAYIVVDPRGGDRPIYVGHANDLRARWHRRLAALHHLGISDANGMLPRPLHVWFGAVRPARGAPRALEHGLVRVLTAMGLGPPALRNGRRRIPFAPVGRIVITGLLPPPYLRPPFAALLARAGQRNNTLVLGPAAPPSG